MSDRDKFHLSASIAVEIIALGVQMMLAPSWGWVLIAGGGVYLFYALYRLCRDKRHLSSIEMQHEIRKREKYLPQLKEVVEHKITRLKELVYEASHLPLNVYRDNYLIGTRQYAMAKKVYPKSENRALLSALVACRIPTDNLYYSKLKEHDEQMRIIEAKYELIIPQIKDKKLRKNLNKLWRSEHISNSITIMAELGKNNPDYVPEVIRALNKGVGLKANVLPNYLKEVMTRINDLLEGAEDE